MAYIKFKDFREIGYSFKEAYVIMRLPMYRQEVYYEMKLPEIILPTFLQRKFTYLTEIYKVKDVETFRLLLKRIMADDAYGQRKCRLPIKTKVVRQILKDLHDHMEDPESEIDELVDAEYDKLRSQKLQQLYRDCETEAARMLGLSKKRDDDGFLFL